LHDVDKGLAKLHVSVGATYDEGIVNESWGVGKGAAYLLMVM